MMTAELLRTSVHVLINMYSITTIFIILTLIGLFTSRLSIDRSIHRRSRTHVISPVSASTKVTPLGGLVSVLGASSSRSTICVFVLTSMVQGQPVQEQITSAASMCLFSRQSNNSAGLIGKLAVMMFEWVAGKLNTRELLPKENNGYVYLRGSFLKF